MIGWLIGAWLALLLACGCIKGQTLLMGVLVGVVVIAAVPWPGRRAIQRRDR